MKKILLFFVFLFVLKCYGQNRVKDSIDEARENNKKKEAQEQNGMTTNEASVLQAFNSAAWHHHLTQFTNISLNFANNRLQYFLSHQMELAETNTSGHFNGKKSFQLKSDYIHTVGFTNVKAFTITIFADTTKTLGELKIKTMNISGQLTEVIELYIKYWPQPLSEGDFKKGEIFNYESFGDHVALKINRALRIATINITPNKMRIYDDIVH